MVNYLKMPKKQQVLALLDLGWSYRRIPRWVQGRWSAAAWFRFNRWAGHAPFKSASGSPSSRTSRYTLGYQKCRTHSWCRRMLARSYRARSPRYPLSCACDSRAGIDWDAFDTLHVEAFRSRDWLVTLYRLTSAVKAEQDAWGKEVVRKYSKTDTDRARANFMDN
jgi:hypothetical protein